MHFIMLKHTLSSKYILILFVLLTVSTFIQAQDKFQQNRSSTIENRWFTGGNLGFQFGDQTFIDVSPLLGYKITENISAGISATYKYFKYNKFYYDPTYNKWYDYTSNVFGGSIFGRYFFMEELFGQAEYEFLHFKHDNYDASGVKFMESSDVSSLFLGGGYRQYVSDNASFDLIVLWNLNESLESPYQNPVIRIGFNLGF